MKNKLHVCCGEVYLKGYHNIDAPIEGYSFLASQRPDIVKVNLTTRERYYKYPFGKHPLKLCVTDELIDIMEIEYPKDYFKEIIMVCAFEHFNLQEARVLLRKFLNWLSKDSALLFDVPDIEASLESIRNNSDIDNLLWNMRLIYGSQKTRYSFHKWGYTKETLEKELQDAGFKKIEFLEIVPHSYPMLGVKAIK